MARQSENRSQSVTDASQDAQTPRYCGIVRPIADMGNYTAKHWRDVHSVVGEAVEPLGFTPRLVSESDASGVILSEIVSNLYEDEIVVVDVSGRNPNVMFELGMRLAFEKPAIIIKDDETPFSFDISPVKHIPYPRSLRYRDIIKFKDDLGAAITATLDPAYERRNYLQQFGPIKVTELGSQSVELSSIAQDVQEMRRVMLGLVARSESMWADSYSSGYYDSKPYTDEDLNSILEIDMGKSPRTPFAKEVLSHWGIMGVDEHGTVLKIYIRGTSPEDVSNIRNSVRSLARRHRSDAS